MFIVIVYLEHSEIPWKRAFVSTMEFIDFSNGSQWGKDRTSFEEEKKEKNQFVRTKMRPKEWTKIELQREICQI